MLNTLSIEQSKLEEIYTECLQTSTKTHLTRKKYQFLFVKLLYLHKVIKQARIFANRILATFRNHLLRRIKNQVITGIFSGSQLVPFIPTFLQWHF